MNHPALRALRPFMFVMALWLAGTSAMADPTASSTVWQPGEERHQWALVDGPGAIQGMILTRQLTQVLENQQLLSQDSPTDWDELMEWEAMFFAPTDSDGSPMPYEPLPFPDATPESDTAGIWLGGWEEESRLTISVSDIRTEPQSFSFMLKPPSKALAYRTPTPDELRENAYLTTLSLTLQEFVSMTGRMPKDFKEVMTKLQLSQTLDEYSSDRVAQIEVSLNRSIPAIKTRIIDPEGRALDRLEIFTIDRKKGLVTTKLHTGTDTTTHPAFGAVYEPFLAVEFPLIDPEPETAEDNSPESE